LRPDREDDWLKLPASIEAPLRQAVVPLQRGQTRSPAQALSNATLQCRHRRRCRTIESLLGFVWYSGFASRRKAALAMVQFLKTDTVGGKKYFVMVASPFAE
jgi:hypothetical protein